MSIRNIKDLIAAILRGDDKIEIEGDLANKTLKIKATGNVAWIVALGAVTIAAYSLMSAPTTTAATGGAGAPVSGLVAAGGGGTAIAILGAPAAIAAVSMVIGARSTGALKKLRERYKISSQNEGCVVLEKIS